MLVCRLLKTHQFGISEEGTGERYAQELKPPSISVSLFGTLS
jgi:hypothetical protein